MYKVYGEIPTAQFTTLEEAENYIKEWEEGCETEINSTIFKEE